MFQNFRRYFYSNKTKIIRNVLVVVFFILIIQGLNYLIKLEAKQNNNISISNQFTYGNLINFGNTSSLNNSMFSNDLYNQNQTISNNANDKNYINNENNIINNENTNNNSNSTEIVLNSFFDLCLEGNVEQAYELISEQCKQVLFPTIEKFEKNYRSRIFDNNKFYTIEEYKGSTYKVNISEDMNTTGAYSPLAYTDYITIISNNEDTKLNIGSYVGRYTINKESTDNDITVTVNYKDVFIDYEKYNISVMNNHSKIIMLNSSNNTDTMYLTDFNGTKYYAYTHELVGSSLILRSGSTAKFNIRYDSNYSTNSKNELVFSNVILDYDTYRKMENKEEYKDIGVIRVKI